MGGNTYNTSNLFHFYPCVYLGVMELWPERCVILMKKALKYAGPFGLGAILAGTIFVDRSNNRSAKEALKHAVDIIHKKNVR